MKKKITAVLLLLCLVSMVVPAQTAATVDGWLRQALTKSNTALTLARRDYNSNADRINQLYREIQDIMLKYQNYLNQGNVPTDNQARIIMKTNANINEINQRMRLNPE
jgi:hypothetical protein